MKGVIRTFQNRSHARMVHETNYNIPLFPFHRLTLFLAAKALALNRHIIHTQPFPLGSRSPTTLNPL